MHLMSDEGGRFPLTSFNKWEREIVLAELAPAEHARLITASPRGPRSIPSSLPTVTTTLATGNQYTRLRVLHEVGGNIV